MAISQSPDELKALLNEQLGFLRRSADSYDEGYVDEAKRLAVTIRVLVHDTSHSRSLLGQLGEKARSFLDTAVSDEQGNLLPYGALVQMAIGRGGASYLPLLDNPLPFSSPKQVAFDEWWEKSIFRNKDGEVISRKQLVLTMADQDGGAHVDPKLDEVYAKLSRHAGMGWVYVSHATHSVVRSPELAAVRQIAHELIKSLDPSYQKQLQVPPESVLIASPVVKVSPTEASASGKKTAQANLHLRPNPGHRKVGRNDPCPCGSGKKYKKCHGY